MRDQHRRESRRGVRVIDTEVPPGVVPPSMSMAPPPPSDPPSSPTARSSGEAHAHPSQRGEPVNVTPTDPPSSAVLIDEHRQLQIRVGAVDRVGYVFARLVFADMASLDGPTTHGRVEHVVVFRPYRFAAEETPASEAGWMLLAEVTVRAAQTVIEAADIHPPGWHHQHGADNPPAEEPAKARTPRTAVSMECRSWESCPSYGRLYRVPLYEVVPGVLARPHFVCADCGMELFKLSDLEETANP